MPYPQPWAFFHCWWRETEGKWLSEKLNTWFSWCSFDRLFLLCAMLFTAELYLALTILVRMTALLLIFGAWSFWLLLEFLQRRARQAGLSLGTSCCMVRWTMSQIGCSLTVYSVSIRSAAPFFTWDRLIASVLWGGCSLIWLLPFTLYVSDVTPCGMAGRTAAGWLTFFLLPALSCVATTPSSCNFF